MPTNATLDGQSVFGGAVRIQEVTKPTATQLNQFFGVDGILALFGGTRGRSFLIEGCFLGVDQSSCVAAKRLMQTFQDTAAHTLTDNFGQSFFPVIFLGELTCAPEGPRPAATFDGVGYAWAYKLALHGLA